MGEIIGTIGGVILVLAVYVLLRWVSPSLPFMPKLAPCPKCGEAGWDDFLPQNARTPKLERKMSTWKTILGVWLVFGSVFCGAFGLLFLLMNDVRGLLMLIMALLGMVWAYRFRAAQPVVSCAHCGYYAPIK